MPSREPMRAVKRAQRAAQTMRRKGAEKTVRRAVEMNRETVKIMSE